MTSVVPISLSKNISQVGIVLDKRSLPPKVTCQVALAIDVSGSMRGAFLRGAVQEALSQLFAVAWLFDDNAQLEVWAFDTQVYSLPNVTLENYERYVDNNITGNSAINWGGTEYQPVLQAVEEYFFGDVRSATKGWVDKVLSLFSGKPEQPIAAPDPVFCIFVTDGESANTGITIDYLRRIQHRNLFVQTIGVQTSLNTLPSLAAELPNVGYAEVDSLDKSTPEALYSKIIGAKFAEWYNKRTR